MDMNWLATLIPSLAVDVFQDPTATFSQLPSQSQNIGLMAFFEAEVVGYPFTINYFV